MYDTESGFYYLQSRYYDPKICRFINADDFASTGQGILGHNMFAYCGNNPVIFEDSSGAIPMPSSENYPEYIGHKISEWLRKLSEKHSIQEDQNSELEIYAQAKKLAALAWMSLDCSVGIGMGFEYEETFLEMIGIGLGMHGDFICVKLQDGNVSYGQEYSSGISASALLQNVGFVESVYNKNFQLGEMEVSLGFYGDESITVFSRAKYCGLGGHFRIGFDTAYFFGELNRLY